MKALVPITLDFNASRIKIKINNISDEKNYKSNHLLFLTQNIFAKNYSLIVFIEVPESMRVSSIFSR